MKLIATVCQGSGPVNEDGIGLLGAPGDLQAAWVFDGVTGINDRAYLPGRTDAAWLVARADHHLRLALGAELAARATLALVVEGLRADQTAALDGIALPERFDPPAACLVLWRRWREGSELIRIGDSRTLVRFADELQVSPDSPLAPDEHAAIVEAQALRETGVTERRDVLERLTPRLHAMRQRRNRPGGYGVLEADPACLDFIEVVALDQPVEVLLCSDGLYRLVDVYHALRPDELLRRAVAPGGLAALYSELRAIEAADPDCRRYPRIKSADDAAAVCLGRA